MGISPFIYCKPKIPKRHKELSHSMYIWQ